MSMINLISDKCKIKSITVIYKVFIRSLIIYLLLGSCSIVYSADETRLGFGTGFLYGKPDLFISFRPGMEHWVYGFRIGYNEQINDSPGFKTKEEETFIGPMVYYLLQPESPDSFYGSVGVLGWTLKHIAPEVQEYEQVSTTALFLGGGFTRRFGDNYFFDIGLSFSIGKEIYAETSVTSIETTGLEGRIMIGFFINE